MKQYNTLAVIGDSLSSAVVRSRFSAVGWHICSNAKDMVAGEGSVRVNDDGTAQWRAPEDGAYGEAVKITAGINWLESYTANMGAGVYITQGHIDSESNPAEYPMTIVQNEDVGYDNIAYVSWCSVLTGGTFEVVGSHGISGSTTELLLERVTDVYKKKSCGMDLVDGYPNIIIMLIGTNDILHIANEVEPNYDLDYSKDNLSKIVAQLVQSGAAVILCTVSLGTPTAEQFSLLQEYNDHIRNICTKYTDVYLADIFNYIRDGLYDDGRALSGTFADNAHFSSAGSFIAAKCIQDTLDEFVIHRHLARYRFAGAEANRVPNGALLGTAGVVTGALATGVAAADVTASATVAVVCSKENVVGQTPWQVFTITDAVAGDTIVLDFPLAEVPADGDHADCEIQLVSGTGVIGTDLQVVLTDGDAQTEIWHSGWATAPYHAISTSSFNGVLRTPAIDVPTFATEASVRLVLTLDDNANTVIKVRNIGL